MAILNYYTELFRINVIETKLWAIFVLIAFGILLFVGAIRDWDWLCKPDGRTYNLSKLNGIINMFGRKTGRSIGSIMGFIIILAGISISLVKIFSISWSQQFSFYVGILEKFI